MLILHLLQTDTKRAQKVRQGLDSSFAYLAGNAFGKDKKGRPDKDAGLSQQDAMSGAAGGDTSDYSAYVCYEVEID